MKMGHGYHKETFTWSDPGLTQVLVMITSQNHLFQHDEIYTERGNARGYLQVVVRRTPAGHELTIRCPASGSPEQSFVEVFPELM